MRIVALVGFCVFFGIFAVHPGVTRDIDDEITKLLYTSGDRLETFHALSAEKKRSLLERMGPLLIRRDVIQYTMPQSVHERLALNDLETIQYILGELGRIEVYNRVLDGQIEVLRAMGNWRAPDSLRAIMPLVLSNEPWTLLPPSDAPSEPLSFKGTSFAYHLVEHIKEFPAAVRAWAPTVYREKMKLSTELQRHAEARNPLDRAWMDGLRFSERRREVMQNWWKTNERAIAEKRYSDVLPGERFAAPSKFLPGIEARLKELNWK